MKCETNHVWSFLVSGILVSLHFAFSHSLMSSLCFSLEFDIWNALLLCSSVLNLASLCLVVFVSAVHILRIVHFLTATCSCAWLSVRLWFAVDCHIRSRLNGAGQVVGVLKVKLLRRNQLADAVGQAHPAVASTKVGLLQPNQSDKTLWVSVISIAFYVLDLSSSYLFALLLPPRASISAVTFASGVALFASEIDT